MKTYTYLIKPAKEISLEQLRKDLMVLEEEFSDEEQPTLLKINAAQKGAVLITPNKDFINALLKDKNYILTEQS